jgi:hypothetical protein
MKADMLEKRTSSQVIRVDGEYRAARAARGGFEISNGDDPFVDEIQRRGADNAILGELFIRVNGDGDSGFDAQRQRLGLNIRRSGPDTSRACLAFARFVSVKAYDALPPGVSVRRAGLANYASVFGLCRDSAEYDLLLRAIHLDAEHSEGGYSLAGDTPLLITSVVYVAPCARRCGISEYIHTNLADIAHVFIGARPKLVVLNCGDFTGEHARLGITETAYKDMLRTHYLRIGYEPVDDGLPYVLWRLL